MIRPRIMANVKDLATYQVPTYLEHFHTRIRDVLRIGTYGPLTFFRDTRILPALRLSEEEGVITS